MHFMWEGEGQGWPNPCLRDAERGADKSETFPAVASDTMK